MKHKTLLNPILILSLILASMASFFAAPRARAASTQAYPSGMVSYWKLDEEGGVIAHDSVGTNNGSITNQNWSTNCMVGPCIQSSSRGATYVNVPDSPSLNITGNQLAVEAWAYPFASSYQDGQGNCGFIAMKATTSMLQYGLCAGGSWAGRFEFHTTTVNGWKAAISPNNFPAGVWYHIVGVYTGSEVQLYVNGVLISATPQSGAIVSSSDPFWMGKYCGGGSGIDWCYSGKTDEVALYNRALTPAEIQEHYQNGLAGLGYGDSQNATSLVTATNTNSELYPGDPISIALNTQNASNLYAAQALCEVDPSVLQLQGGDFGDFFDQTLRLVAANQVDATAGKWLGAISQQNPAAPLSGDGLFATLNYVASAPGMTSLNCEPLFSDRDGFSLPVSFTGTNITVLPFGILNGVARYQGRLDHIGIEITATGPVTQTVHANASGNFALDQLKTGNYSIQASAAGYLPSCTTSNTTSGQTVTLTATTLKGGNASNDGAINIGDATLIAANFGLQAPPADTRADINGDTVVNIQDLAILGGNYGLAGCQSW